MCAPSPTLDQANSEYLNYQVYERGCAATTRRCYQHALRRFCRFLTTRYGREPLVAEVTEVDVRDFLYGLSQRKLRPRTLRGAMDPVRGLFGLAVQRGWRADNPALAVRLPRKDPARRDTVSDEELEQLFAGCDREPSPMRRAMMRAVLAVFSHGALRRQELLDLKVGDVDLNRQSLLVQHGKGNKQRIIFVCQACVDALRDWLRMRPATGHGYLFITVSDSTRRLGDNGLRRLLLDVRSFADLRDHDNITPHAIRHAAATRLLRNGADIRSIQAFLGHTDLRTTAVYLHTDEQQLRRIAELTDLRAEPRGTECVQHAGPEPRNHRGRRIP